MSYISLLADDKNLITYRPSLNQLTGSVTATILFQQILYWWKANRQQPFYKFNAPCSNDLYQVGDSWQEELGFTRKELETARKRIAKKVAAKDWRLALAQNQIVFWTDRSRVTWYAVNSKAVENALSEHYLMHDCDITLMPDSYITRLMPESGITRLTKTTKDHQTIDDGDDHHHALAPLLSLGFTTKSATALLAKIKPLYGDDLTAVVTGWCDYATATPNVKNPAGFVRHKLTGGEYPPEPKTTVESQYDSLPDELKGIVKR